MAPSDRPATKRLERIELAIIAAIVLFYMQNPWFFPADGSTERAVAIVAFWVLAIVVLVLTFEDRKAPAAQTVEVEGPAFTRYLFSNTRAGLVWLPTLGEIAVALGLLAWKIAGYYGVDRWLRPQLGVPWRSRVTTGGPPQSGAPAG